MLYNRCPRDRTAIMTIGRQLFPNNSKAVLDAYTKAMNDHEELMDNPYGYLCIDATVHCSKHCKQFSTRDFKFSHFVPFMCTFDSSSCDIICVVIADDRVRLSNGLLPGETKIVYVVV